MLIAVCKARGVASESVLSLSFATVGSWQHPAPAEPASCNLSWCHTWWDALPVQFCDLRQEAIINVLHKAWDGVEVPVTCFVELGPAYTSTEHITH